MTTVIPIKALSTNLVYLHRCGDGRAFVVDPSDAGAVLQVLQQHDLALTAILVTHHHWDHVAGAEDLQRKAPCELIGVGHTLVPAPDRGATNIFLQAERPQIATPLGMVGAPPEEVFAELRRRKDEFGG